MLVTPGAVWHRVGSDLDSIVDSETSRCSAIEVIAVQTSLFSLCKVASAGRKLSV